MPSLFIQLHCAHSHCLSGNKLYNWHVECRRCGLISVASWSETLRITHQINITLSLYARLVMWLMRVHPQSYVVHAYTIWLLCAVFRFMFTFEMSFAISITFSCFSFFSELFNDGWSWRVRSFYMRKRWVNTFTLRSIYWQKSEYNS